MDFASGGDNYYIDGNIWLGDLLELCRLLSNWPMSIYEIVDSCLESLRHDEYQECVRFVHARILDNLDILIDIGIAKKYIEYCGLTEIMDTI